MDLATLIRKSNGYSDLSFRRAIFEDPLDWEMRDLYASWLYECERPGHAAWQNQIADLVRDAVEGSNLHYALNALSSMLGAEAYGRIRDAIAKRNAEPEIDEAIDLTEFFERAQDLVASIKYRSRTQLGEDLSENDAQRRWLFMINMELYRLGKKLGFDDSTIRAASAQFIREYVV